MASIILVKRSRNCPKLPKSRDPKGPKTSYKCQLINGMTSPVPPTLVALYKCKQKASADVNTGTDLSHLAPEKKYFLT